MFILLHCGGMPFNGNTVKTTSLGGSESAAYYVAKELSNLGHTVTLFTQSADEGEFDGVRYCYAGDETKAAPLGDRFHYYAQHTPHDVCIIQRHPQAFAFKWASKINIWWLHDLALKRNSSTANAHMQNIDFVLTVSEYHKKQICDVWGFNPEVVKAITNGVDLSLFEGDLKTRPDGFITDADTFDRVGTRLLYSSRPERGLEEHVKPGGIMERLWDIDPTIHLFVCAYANETAQTREYYQYLRERCEELPNVTDMGSLTKRELADVMRSCDALVYPTTFEEVSCITAMEAMAAGLTFIASAHAALPETCTENVLSASRLLPLLAGEVVPLDFVVAVEDLCDYHKPKRASMKYAQLEAAKFYTWDRPAKAVVAMCEDLFANVDDGTMARHLIQHSDIQAFHWGNSPIGGIECAAFDERRECYDPMLNNPDGLAEHYEGFFKDHAVLSWDVAGTPRYETIKQILSDLPNGSHVLDYGCGHGHYTISLAKAFPKLFFLGVDISDTNIRAAIDKALDDDVDNVGFITVGNYTYDNRADAIILAEILEHVVDPQALVDGLCSDHLVDGGQVIATTPYGVWESLSFKERHPWREHLHHFERADLHDMFGHHPNFRVLNIPHVGSAEVLGSYVTQFKKPTEASRAVDYPRKLATQRPRQTVSLCMIVKDAEADIQKCLESIVDHIDEVIIGIDETTNDDTKTRIGEVLAKYETSYKAATIFEIKSPLETGFDEARNATIERACGDWILWLDSDEVVDVRANLGAWLRNNQFDAYAVAQHHFTIEPAGVMKTDYPARLFRNHKGIKFFGRVHEHPEKGLNEGAGHARINTALVIGHYGYKSEDVRRGRFSRNIDLMYRDREDYPTRKLGRMLWVRDCCHMARYEFERFHRVTERAMQYAEEGIAEWFKLVCDGEIRLVIDSLDFYSALVEATGGGIEFWIGIDASAIPGEVEARDAKRFAAIFRNREHIDGFVDMLMDSKLKGIDDRRYL